MEEVFVIFSRSIMIEMTENPRNKKIGLIALSAIVFSMMVGSGIFNLPQNMAAGAGLPAVIIAWLITAAGMLTLVYTFHTLAIRRPGLRAGIYQYAQDGFGNYPGFLMAWGYWLCVCVANVTYAVMLSDTFGAFFPFLLKHGWSTVGFGTVLIWIMYFLTRAGMKSAANVTTALTIIKLVPIVLIVILFFIYCKAGIFDTTWTDGLQSGSQGLQIRDTMMVTLWCFIGIEGAAMLSARARNTSDVGKACIIGFSVAWLLYVIVSVLAFGILAGADLSALKDPSVAYLLKDTCGAWAYYFVIISVIVSLLGSWLAWTLVCAQMPYEAAETGIFPRSFTRINSKGVPAYGLRISSIIMNLFLILVVVAGDVYMTSVRLTGMMILPCYLFSSLYLVRFSYRRRNRRFPRGWEEVPSDRWLPEFIIGLGSTVFCLWMLYAAGPQLWLTSIFYLIGTGFYLVARREQGISKIRLREKLIFIFLCLTALVSVILALRGII